MRASIPDAMDLIERRAKSEGLSVEQIADGVIDRSIEFL